MKHIEKIAIAILLLVVIGLLTESGMTRKIKEPTNKTHLTQDEAAVKLEEKLREELKKAQEVIKKYEQEALDKKQGAKRLGIVTIHTPPYYSWANLSIPNKKKYAKKHGYGLYIEHGKSDERHPVWSKLTSLLQHMEEDKHEWFWALDIDALIINGNKKATDVLDDNYDLIVQSDCNMFNAGSFMIKNSEWSKEYLKRVLKIEKPTIEGLREQSAMMDVYHQDEETKRHFKWVQQRDLNAYRDYPSFCDQTRISGIYEEGDLVIHFPGHSGWDQFPGILKEWLAKETGLPDDLYP
ncbi:hypothetical protein EDD86DRAFT_214074 [Gorgonomyces haynaldii]|nr:hypothetical protein EDD86DRAFT_214074 [Gorgonomyces haynaldii]